MKLKQNFAALAALSGAVFLGLAGISDPVLASTTGTGNASAVIVSPLSVSETAGMNFGDIDASGGAGTVIVSTAGAASVTGSVAMVNSGPDTPSADLFTIGGLSGASYTLSLPASATLTSGVNTMTVDTFTASSTNSYVLTGGSDTLAVGGTLHVAAGQAAGTYTGTYNLTVTYQ